MKPQNTLNLAGKLLTTIGAILYSADANAQTPTVKIKTEPQQTAVVADGRTVYQMNVTADLTAFPTKKFVAGEWDVIVPYSIQITGASLPSPDNPSTNPADLFFDFYMDEEYNRVDGTPDGNNKLTDNVRYVSWARDGPSNRVGDLGWYYFTVPRGTPVGVRSFGLVGVFLYDTTGARYTIADHNLTPSNTPFTVYHQCDYDVDGDVDLSDFATFQSCFNGPNRPAAQPGSTPTEPCYQPDSDGDGDVDLSDFGAFQSSFNGPNRPPATALYRPDTIDRLARGSRTGTLDDKVVCNGDGSLERRVCVSSGLA